MKTIKNILCLFALTIVVCAGADEVAQEVTAVLQNSYQDLKAGDPESAVVQEATEEIERISKRHASRKNKGLKCTHGSCLCPSGDCDYYPSEIGEVNRQDPNNGYGNNPEYGNNQRYANNQRSTNSKGSRQNNGLSCTGGSCLCPSGTCDYYPSEVGRVNNQNNQGSTHNQGSAHNQGYVNDLGRRNRYNEGDGCKNGECDCPQGNCNFVGK